MLATIDFNNQQPLEANKVGHVRPDRALATEFAPGYLAQTNHAPEPMLGVGHGAAQLSGHVPFLSLSHPCDPHCGAVAIVARTGRGDDRRKACWMVGFRPPLDVVPHPNLPPRAGEGAKPRHPLLSL